MNLEHVRALRKMLHDEAVAAIIARHHIDAEMARDPIGGPGDIDLNQHLSVRHVVGLAVAAVERDGDGVRMTRESVLEMWCTELLFKLGRQ